MGDQWLCVCVCVCARARNVIIVLVRVGVCVRQLSAIPTYPPDCEKVYAKGVGELYFFENGAQR